MAEEPLDPAEGDKAAHGSHVLALLPTPAKLAVRVRGDAAQPLGQPLELTVDVTGPHKVRAFFLGGGLVGRAGCVG
jgi:hypothetical protein